MSKQRIHGLTPEQLVAIAGLKGNGFRKEVEAGDYDIDCIVHIKGTMSVGKDYPVTPSHKIPWMLVVALMAQRMTDLKIENAMSIVQSIMTDAMSMDEKARKVFLENMPELAEMEGTIKAALGALPSTTQKGPVSTHLEVNMVKDNLSAQDDTENNEEENAA